LAQLARNKRSADSSFRKVKLALEGPPPKKAVPQKKSDDKGDDKKSTEDKKDADDKKDAQEEVKEKPFKPTATKKQFVSTNFANHILTGNMHSTR
jgi:hypothetical protein